MQLFEPESQPIELPLKHGEGWYLDSFLNPTEQKDLLNHLWSSYEWERPEIKVFGKTHRIPRMAAWVADEEVGYDYSGVKHVLQPWTEELENVKRRIEKITETNFNSVLINTYRDGNDKMGWHSDNEKALGNDPLIASLNLGVARRFDLRNIADPGDEIKLHLQPGSLLFMGSGVQSNYKHQVPIQKKVEGLRINLTFRMVLE